MPITCSDIPKLILAILLPVGDFFMPSTTNTNNDFIEYGCLFIV